MSETIIRIPGKLVASEYGTKLANFSDLDNNVYGPYTSVTAAHSALLAAGLNTIATTVGIIDDNNEVKEYWYQGGTEQVNLVKKVLGKENHAVSFDGFIILEPVTIIEGSAFEPDAILYSRNVNRFVAKKGNNYYDNWEERGLYNNGNAPYTSKIYPYNGKSYTWNGTTFEAEGADALRFEAQTLTAQQKEQVAQNIGLDTVVKGDVQQLLSDAQKVQAQNNMMGKAYAPAQNSGLGKVYLDKNNGMLTQSMINTANTVYVIQYDYTLAANITIPANCTLQFDGGSISVGGDYKTITGNGTIIIAEPCKIFGSGIVLSGTWNNDDSYSQWFDFSKNGSYDDTQSFQNLLNITHNIYIEKDIIINIASILYPSKYTNGNSSCRLRSNTTIYGNNATLRLADGMLLNTNTNILWSVENISNVKLYDLCFDGNSKNNKFNDTGFERTFYFIYIDGGKDVVIERCKFLNSAGRNCIVLNRKSSGDYHNAHISDCYFRNGGAYISDGTFNSNQNDITFFYTEFENTVIENCLFVNCDLDTQEDIEDVSWETRYNYVKNPESDWGDGGVELHASNCKCLNNTFIGCRIGCYIAKSTHITKVTNIDVSGNCIKYCSLGINIYPSTNTEDIRILDNDIAISGTNATQQMGIGTNNQPTSFSMKNAIISNNHIMCLEPSNTACLIKLFMGENITVRNNSLYANTNEHAISIVDSRANYSDLNVAKFENYVISGNIINFAEESPKMSAINCDYSLFYGSSVAGREISNIAVIDNIIRFNDKNTISTVNAVFNGLLIFNNKYRRPNVSDIDYVGNRVFGKGDLVFNDTESPIDIDFLEKTFNFVITDNTRYREGVEPEPEQG